MKRFKFGLSKDTSKEKERKKKAKSNELMNFQNSTKKQQFLYFDNLAYGTGLKNV